MLCYKDKSFCSTPVERCTCDDYYKLTEQDKENAKRLGLAIAVAKFCDPNEDNR